MRSWWNLHRCNVLCHYVLPFFLQGQPNVMWFRISFPLFLQSSSPPQTWGRRSQPPAPRTRTAEVKWLGPLGSEVPRWNLDETGMNSEKLEKTGRTLGKKWETICDTTAYLKESWKHLETISIFSCLSIIMIPLKHHGQVWPGLGLYGIEFPTWMISQCLWPSISWICLRNLPTNTFNK